MKDSKSKLSQSTQRDVALENSAHLKTNSTIEHILCELVETSGLDRDTCEQILLMYIRQSLELLKQLKRYLAEKDYETSKALFHKLKGSSGNVRAYEVMVLAEASEKAIDEKGYDIVSEWVEQISEKLLGYQCAFKL